MAKKFSVEDIRNIIENTSKCKFLSHYKEKGQIIVNLECDCEKEFSQRLSKFKDSPYKKCKKCTTSEKMSNSHRLKDEVVFEYLNNFGLKILEKYKGVDIEALFECSCGREFSSTFYKIKKSKYKKCRKCVDNMSSDRQKWTNDEFLNRISNLPNIDEYEILTEYKGSQVKIEILHKTCGTETKLTPRMLIEGQRCRFCSKSLGERKIEKYLIDNNINFKAEYRFKNCRDKRPLPFDFYFPDHNIAIEMQGEIHYEEFLYSRSKGFFGGVKAFLLRKKHDLMKSKYCRENNIRLIHIHYYEKNVINKTLKHLLMI